LEDFEFYENYEQCHLIKQSLDSSILDYKERGVFEARLEIPTRKKEFLEMVANKKWPLDLQKEEDKVKTAKNKIIEWLVK